MPKKKPLSNTIKTNGRDGSEKPELHHDHLVVGIGASAGGIQALSTFFANVPPKSGIAFVVILHLSPNHDSKLAEVLQHTTRMPVTQVTEKTKVEPDHVFVVSPDRSLSMLDGHIGVKPLKTVEERRAPVDIFFRTLAETAGPNAVGVILSGSGANGSMGLKRIKEYGGATFAQNPREAEFNEMPRNAIATELVDAILPVSEIPGKILAYRDNRKAITIADEPKDRSEDQQTALRDIFTYLRVRTGHDFSNYKRPTMLRRIERRVSVKNLPDIQAYTAYIRENPGEAQYLLKDLLISVTNFFRDKKSFETLEKKVVSRLLDGRDAKRPVRVWVAGVATGEEAYSLAMIFAERTMGELNAPGIQVFATDIDEQAIAVAREGLYTLNDAADVSPERLRRFFTKEGDNYRIRREIREMVLFAQHNVLKDPPFSHLDLITCRNLLIYLNQTAQERVLETAHFALEPGGFLFIGSSESVDGAGDLFAAFDKESHIYQSRQVTARPLPVPESVPMYRGSVPAVSVPDGRAQKAALERISYNDLHLKLVEEFAPPSIVVNPEYEIVHISEHAGRFLHVIGGEPTKNLLRLVRPEIRLELRGALFQAVQQKTNVEARGLKVKFGETAETINLLIRPILDEDDTARGYILIVFERADRDEESAQPAEYVAPEPVAQQLEEELVRSRGQLQSALEQAEVQSEELRASNEELQAMNEELRSSAEELETSKEELQSINEELTTVNQELKVKIDELSHTNANFQNLLNSIDIGVIFLDRSLRVNLFSPAARRIFNLISNDVGRPLSDITSRITYDDLARDAESVIESLQTLEREVDSVDGRVFVARMLPYRTPEDRLNGVVITFVDITERKSAEKMVMDSRQRLRRMMNIAGVGILAFDFDSGVLIDANDAFLQMTGYTRRQVERRELTWRTMTPAEFIPESEEQMAGLAATGTIGPYEKQYFRRDGSRSWMLFAGAMIGDGEIVEYCVDINDRVRMETALHESEQRLRLVTDSFVDYAIISMNKDRMVEGWNPGAEAIFGYKADEIVGKSADILFTPEDRVAGVPDNERALAVKKGRASDERWHMRKGGARFFASGIMAPLFAGDHNVVGFAKIARDLTNRVETEQALRERGMLQRLVEAQEEERQRIARDLHDQLGQQLTALRLKVEGLKSGYGAEPAMIKAIDETQEMAKRIDDDVSFMTWELRPTALDTLGLRKALAAFVNEWSRNYGIKSEFHSSGTQRKRLIPEMEVNLYRIAQEALNNVMKHARAKKVDVMLEFGKSDVVLVVEDNGQGFDLKSAERRSKSGKGLGLVGMRERAALLGGTLEIESVRHKGTTVIARIPLRFVDSERGAGKRGAKKTKASK